MNRMTNKGLILVHEFRLPPRRFGVPWVVCTGLNYRALSSGFGSYIGS